jgi:DNA-binding GntR family transcriptional regulator
MLDLAEPNILSQTRRRADNVYHALKRAILLRERQPGDALLEQDVAAEMNCSQGTVREAMMRLHHDGLVTRRGYRGTVVSHTSADEAALLANLRIRIEMMAAERATTSPGREFEELVATVAAMREQEARGDTYALSELDHRFHGLILRAARLESVEPILTRCMLHLHRHTVGNPVRLKHVHNSNAADAHELLLSELRTGNVVRAQGAARAHIEGVIRRWSPDVWKIMDSM